MLINSNIYQIRNKNTDIFISKIKHEFPITFVEKSGPSIIFSSRNELFSKTEGRSKKITTFESDISSLSVQQGLICAGGFSGALEIFSEYRKCLRHFDDHSAAINQTIITDENVIVSCSNDSTLRFYNLSDEKSFRTIAQNDGYIKSIACAGDLLFAGSENLRVYSLSTFENIYTFELGTSISHIASINQNTVVFSSKNKLYILDITNPSAIFSRIVHIKDITSLHVENNKIYTSSVDRHFKAFNFDLKVIGDFILPEKILDAYVQNDCPLFALKDGEIWGLADAKKIKSLKSYVSRKKAYEEEISYVSITNNKKRMTNMEYMLKRYEYKQCLKDALAKNDVESIYSVLCYLKDHKGLTKALIDGDEDFLASFLEFCIDNFRTREFQKLIPDCLSVIVTNYKIMIQNSESLQEMMEILSEIIEEEICVQEAIYKSLSFLDSFKSQL
jgi:UTP15 C terminal